jgi:hypothetical protein
MIIALAVNITVPVAAALAKIERIVRIADLLVKPGFTRHPGLECYC